MWEDFFIQKFKFTNKEKLFVFEHEFYLIGAQDKSLYHNLIKQLFSDNLIVSICSHL